MTKLTQLDRIERALVALDTTVRHLSRKVTAFQLTTLNEGMHMADKMQELKDALSGIQNGVNDVITTLDAEAVMCVASPPRSFTRNGRRSSPPNFSSPAMIRAIVAGASGFFRPKMLLPSSVQSITSRAGRHRRAPVPSFACVGTGQRIGPRPRRA